MAIISLKELTLRYSPTKDTLDQLIRDYYAIYPLWKKEGSGAMKFGGGPSPEKRTEVIDQVFEQVATMLAERIVKISKDVDFFRKIAANISHHLKMEDWIELHAEMEKIIHSYLGNATFYAAKNKVERDPLGAAKKDGVQISSLIKQLVSTSKIAPRSDAPTDVPTPDAAPAPEPTLTVDPTPEPTPAAEPTPAEPTPTPRVAPSLPPGIPPLGAPMAGQNPKRLMAMEQELEKYGYKWSEEDQVYKNDKWQSTITINQDNSSVVRVQGKEFTFPNLGELFKKMALNKQKRHTKAAEPSAQITEAHYKTLFGFLYN